mgnify:CR=1 FL=1|jgi:hypothetical protein
MNSLGFIVLLDFKGLLTKLQFIRHQPKHIIITFFQQKSSIDGNPNFYINIPPETSNR